MARARKLFRSARYAETVSLLEPLVLEYRENAEYFRLLGISCFRLGDFGGAYTYFSRAVAFEDSDADSDISLWLAAIQLKRGSTQKALDIYLSVLDREGGNAIASRGLEALRKHATQGALDVWLASKSFESVVPASGSISRKWLLLFVFPLALILVWGGFRVYEGLQAARNASRPSVAGFSLSPSEKADAATFGGQYRYVMGDSDIVAAFDKAKSLFVDYRDGAALVETNRILGSNASDAVKEKAKSLASFADTPTFLNVKDRFTYEDVAKDPVLFEGVPVIWSGRVTNFSRGKTGASFDFLVGYKDQKQLEGVVQAEVPFPVDIDPSRPLELLATVRPSRTGFALSVIAVHELKE